MPNSAIPGSVDLFAPGHLGELTRQVAPELIDIALETGGGIEQRLRRIPSRVVVYLLLAGTLFAGEGWPHVWAHLTAPFPAASPRPAKSSLTAAMRRVGPKPLRELFALLAGPGITSVQQAARFAGRRVVAIDGTQIPIADTEANRLAFPKGSSGPNGPAGYPMIRLVTLVACGTRSVIEAVFGSDRVGELTYADRLIPSLKSGMLLLGDRNFATYKLFTQIARHGADFLIRGKTGNGAMKLPAIRYLPDGSFLAIAAGVRVRVIDAVITITTDAGIRLSEYRLITTLIDPAEAPAERLVQLYHQRWEIETTYCELKSTILGGRVLRARYPSGVEQEVWALLTVYQALRQAMSDAILHRNDLAAGRLSFTTALLAAREQIARATGAMPDTPADLIGKIGAAILENLIPLQGPRTRPRVIKRAISKYRAKGRDIDRRTYPATLRTRIQQTKPDP